MQQQVLDHIRASVPLAATVDHAYSMEPVDSLQEQAPAVFLYPGVMQSEPSDMDSVVIQHRNRQLILLVVAKLADFDALQEQLRTALQGYQPAPELEPLQHITGQPMDARAGYLWWKDVWVSGDFVRQENS